ncbi:heparinase II/III family protein [Micrococcaceae bacterium Sec5.7]
MKEAVARQLPNSNKKASRSRAEQFLKEGLIVSPRFGPLPYDGGNIWADSTQRARARFVHGFIFFSDWHGTIWSDAQVATSYADSAVSIIRTWAATYADGKQLPAASHHDETTAQRLIQLTALLLELDVLVSEEDYRWLVELALDTARLLDSEKFHSTGNNHGMFQDLALLYFSVLCESIPNEDRQSFFETSTRRLHSYFSSSFTPDGVHVENTPTYHLMVARHVHAVLEILSQISHEHADFYRALLEDAAEYATHALMPNGMYPPISDTTQQFETSAARQNIFGSDEFVYAASAGKHGTRPSSKTLVLPDSGYAIYRSSWGDPHATFAFFSAAYNANYHKHSDDLSFFLRSAGVDLLCEAGAYGYDYKDPLTKFAYSSYAHNCLVVDGISLPRTDKFSHLTTLESHHVREDGYRVTGRTERLKETVHCRTVDIHEASGIPEIDIVDAITSNGDHSYELLWNLGPDVEPVVHGQGFELFHNGRKVMDLQFDADVPTHVSLHTGEKRPKYLGWRFPSFGQVVPSPVVKISFSGNGASIHSRIRLADFNYLDRGLTDGSLAWKRTKGTVGLNHLSVPARTESGSGKLAVVFSAIHQPGDFTFNYKKSVDGSGVHALYILDDFGDQGSYYLADHGDRSIFESVQALIARELARLGLTSADLIMAGSSKGASAAILHGIAAGAGRILAGAPQVKIGSFLRKPHPNILGFIMGDASEEAVTSLDQVMFTAIENKSDATRLSILVGESDHHYRNHVLPLKAHASTHSKALELTVLPGLPHAEIGGVYKSFLSANIHQEILGSREEAMPYSLQASKAAPGELAVRIHRPSGWEAACRLYCGSRLVARTPYSDGTTVAWAGLSPGRYRVRIFLRNPDTSVVRPFTTHWSTVA